jgi:hypothetical protein
MKKIAHYFKHLLSQLLKIIITIMMGLGASMGKKPFKIAPKDNIPIEGKK